MWEQELDESQRPITRRSTDVAQLPAGPEFGHDRMRTSEGRGHRDGTEWRIEPRGSIVEPNEVLGRPPAALGDELFAFRHLSDRMAAATRAWYFALSARRTLISPVSQQVSDELLGRGGAFRLVR